MEIIALIVGGVLALGALGVLSLQLRLTSDRHASDIQDLMSSFETVYETVSDRLLRDRGEEHAFLMALIARTHGAAGVHYEQFVSEPAEPLTPVTHMGAGE